MAPVPSVVSNQRFSKGIEIIAVASVLGLAVAFAYWPGLSGPFVFDDIPNIVANPAVALESLDPAGLQAALLSNESGMLKRPLSALSFALNHYVSGGFHDPVAYKITNVLIHVLNALLVYCLCRLLWPQIARRAGVAIRYPALIAALTAFAWALHPLQLTSVLYVVQRMTSLSALCVLSGLVLYVVGRRSMHGGPARGFALMTLGWLGGTGLGVLFKENAALLPLLMLVIELTCFGGEALNERLRRRLNLFLGFTVGAPMLAALLILASVPSILLDPYLARPFSIAERLLSESRILWFYLSLLFFPGVARLGLFHDDIAVSRGLFEPWATFPSLLAIVAVAAAAIYSRRRYRAFAFAALWFLVGHSMESSVIGLELVHEHRNYLPSFGVAFGLGYGLTRVAHHYRAGIALGVLMTGAVALLLHGTYTRAGVWSSEEGLIRTLALHHPASARTQYMLGELYAKRSGMAPQALAQYAKAARLAPWEPAYLLKLVVAGARVTVVEQPGTGSEARPAGAPSKSGGPALPAAMTIGRLGERLAVVPQQSMLERIANAMAREPIGAFTILAVEELVGCVLREGRECEAYYLQVARWLEGALQNPRVAVSSRGQLAVQLANVYLEYGKYPAALRIAGLGKTLVRKDPTFHLVEANAYLLMGELSKAENVIMTTIEAFGPLKGIVLSHADTLLQAVRSRQSVHSATKRE